MAPNRARIKYQEDLKAASETEFPHISNITKGDAEGEFVFTFSHQQLDQDVEIRVWPQEVTGYQDDNLFLVYTNSDVPIGFAKVLEDFLPTSMGMKISEVLSKLTRQLRNFLSPVDEEGADEDTLMTDAEEDEDWGEDADEDDFGGEDSDFDGGDEPSVFGLDSTYESRAQPFTHVKKVSPSVLSRIRRDFRATREAGYKVGVICGFDTVTEYSILSLSVRVDKLCLSSETLVAWNLLPSDFFVLLIKYDGDYATYDRSLDQPAGMSRLSFRVRKCSSYKPSVRQAIAAFVETKRSSVTEEQNEMKDTTEPSISLLSIGQSLDMFMDQDFIPMLKLKAGGRYSWDQAKRHISQLSKLPSQLLASSGGLLADMAPEKDNNAKLPSFVARQPFQQGGEISLPLIAIQFALRYFIRCTDYCMICHQQVEGNFEALKPYVCGDSLCLFQYMSLGFGPSIDHEIINQPYVVDLLISFCYASLFDMPRIREFPTGLNLMVPNMRAIGTLIPPGARTVVVPEGVLIDPISVTFDWQLSKATVDQAEDISHAGLKEGQWVVLAHTIVAAATETVLHHGRIEGIVGTRLEIRVASRHFLVSSNEFPNDDEFLKSRLGTGPVKADLVLYNQNMDDLDLKNKAYLMTLLLRSLPGVMDMRLYLSSRQGHQLATWDRLTPSAMSLLRWIVASNRSFIVQVDNCGGEEPEDINSFSREDERIQGLPGWIQFRFAQGSPEKEMLFQEALKEVDKPFKTILAWHGSHIGNWHSIIRQGLNFDKTVNGRAYGDGVYFAREFSTSLGYCHLQYGNRPQSINNGEWPNSSLKIRAAMSLNELVNLPETFQSNSPFFVVQHIHWIQCRYLLVQPRALEQPATNNVPANSVVNLPRAATFTQDGKWKITGPNGNMIQVPRIAIPSACLDEKSESVQTSQIEARGHSGDSGDEDVGDVDFLFEDEDEDGRATPTNIHDIEAGSPPSTMTSTLETGFCPGSLDMSTLPKLNPPSYANDQAQRTIGREITKLQKVQATTPLNELGWYIDFEKISNMFHWIIELHSFEPELPIAQDMKAAKISSVVLEMRFGPDFPLSPPFVRVIRPRFLPFMSGGGGHITAGGALCMELLTNSGWSPVNSIEAVLLQVRMAITSVDPQPARLDKSYHGRYDYGVGEAVDAYTRAARAHGWAIPNDIHQTTSDSAFIGQGLTPESSDAL